MKTPLPPSSLLSWARPFTSLCRVAVLMSALCGSQLYNGANDAAPQAHPDDKYVQVALQKRALHKGSAECDQATKHQIIATASFHKLVKWGVWITILCVLGLHLYYAYQVFYPVIFCCCDPPSPEVKQQFDRYWQIRKDLMNSHSKRILYGFAYPLSWFKSDDWVGELLSQAVFTLLELVAAVTILIVTLVHVRPIRRYWTLWRNPAAYYDVTSLEEKDHGAFPKEPYTQENNGG